MLFSYAVRAMYIESCSMFVRGGVYRVVKEAMGSTLAKFSVSALMFDYILTGPISGVSAGQYLTGFLNEFFATLPPQFCSSRSIHLGRFCHRGDALFLVGEHQGHSRIQRKSAADHVRDHRDGGRHARLVLLHRLGARASTFRRCRRRATDVCDRARSGWLKHSSLPHTVALIGILIGLGHSVLAMSGEETLAQVYREIEHPKLPNLEKAGLVIFVYSLVFTAGVSFFAFMIIPDAVRPQYFGNLISGLAMNFVGPFTSAGFPRFVVIVGVLMLAGAVNTAIVGSNGVSTGFPRMAFSRSGSAARIPDSGLPTGCSIWSSACRSSPSF